MFSEANSLKSRSLNGKFTNVVSLLVRILDSENRFRSVIVASQGQNAGTESLVKALLGSRNADKEVYAVLSLLGSPPLWSLVISHTKKSGPTLG